ncbi:ethylene-responsive transcription factor ERF017-like [Aristolochia californica]|uniref:ethylene-responsive transcription factor ERF017-like n=1 Tax=Aristolochia californica TaxID=171875 RepID=UPI0035DFBF5C
MKPTADKHSGKSDQRFKGVRKRKWGKYVSEIRLPNSRERIWLGSYDTPEKAARAFDAAMFCLRGKNSDFNFPDNPPEIAGGQFLSPPEIQAVAARFANDAPPVPEKDTSTFDSMSPSSGSDAGFLADGDATVDWSSFLDSLAPLDVQTGTSGSEFGFFPGELDYMPGDIFSPLAEADFGADNSYSQQSFLWNF